MHCSPIGRATFSSRFLLVALASLTLTSPAARAAEAHAATVTNVRDATGVDVAVPERASRIVTLAPSLAELAAELIDGHLERIAGVSEFTDFPQALSSKPSIGPYSKVNLERVLSLKPDLVLATTDGNSQEQIKRLRGLGLTVVVVATSNFAEIERSIQITGDALGEHERGAALLARLQKGLEGFRERASKRPEHPSVLLQLNDQPLIVAGAGTFLNEALKLVGGQNAFGDLKQGYPKPSLEEVIRRDPDRILVLALGGGEVEFNRMISRWKNHAKMKAVKNHVVLMVKADGLLRPSARLLEGLKTLEGAVHGDR